MLIIPFVALLFPLLIKAAFAYHSKVAANVGDAFKIALSMVFAACATATSLIVIALSFTTNEPESFPVMIPALAAITPFLTDVLLLRFFWKTSSEKALLVSVGSNIVSSFITVPIIGFAMIVGFFAFLGTAQ